MSVEIDVDVVNFTTGGLIDKLGDGSIRINASNSGQVGAELIIQPTGSALLKGKELATKEYVDAQVAGAGSGYATEDFVRDAISGAVPPDLASESFVLNSIQDAGFATQAYVDQAVANAAPASVPWIAPTLLNGWANYINTTNGASAGYRLKNGRVELRGLVAGGVKNAVIFVLPQAYRVKEPSQYKQIQLPCTAAEKHANLLVKSTGEVVVNAHDAASLTWVSLNGISFPID